MTELGFTRRGFLKSVAAMMGAAAVATTVGVVRAAETIETKARVVRARISRGIRRSNMMTSYDGSRSYFAEYDDGEAIGMYFRPEDPVTVEELQLERDIRDGMFESVRRRENQLAWGAP